MNLMWHINLNFNQTGAGPVREPAVEPWPQIRTPPSTANMDFIPTSAVPKSIPTSSPTRAMKSSDLSRLMLPTSSLQFLPQNICPAQAHGMGSSSNASEMPQLEQGHSQLGR